MCNIYCFTGLVEESVSLRGENYYVMTVGDDLYFTSEVLATSLRKAIQILDCVLADKVYSLDKVYTVINHNQKKSIRFLRGAK